jgi:hypothetical protein
MPETPKGLTEEELAPDPIEPLGPEDLDPPDPQQKARPAEEFAQARVATDTPVILNDGFEVARVLDEEDLQ